MTTKASALARFFSEHGLLAEVPTIDTRIANLNLIKPSFGRASRLVDTDKDEAYYTVRLAGNGLTLDEVNNVYDELTSIFEAHDMGYGMCMQKVQDRPPEAVMGIIVDKSDFPQMPAILKEIEDRCKAKAMPPRP